MRHNREKGRCPNDLRASFSGGLVMACLLACLMALPCPAHALLPGNLPGQSSNSETVPPAKSTHGSDAGQSLESIRQKIKEVRLRHQEVRSALAAKSPPSYASFDELSSRQIILFETRLALDAWLNALENLQKIQQAGQDLERNIQNWSGFNINEPYPLSLADQLAAELRSKDLELQTEEARTSMEEDQVPVYRKTFEQTGPKVRKAAEAFEKARKKNEARLRWLLEFAEDKQRSAEAKLQATLAKVELNKQRVSLLNRERDFLEEKLRQTLGKTEFTRTDLDARLKAVTDQRELLRNQLAEAERRNTLAQQQAANARETLEKGIQRDGQSQAQQQLFELRLVEAETASQRIETLKMLLVANSLETILWQERFRVYSGLKRAMDLAEVLRNLDTWQERLRELNDYYFSRYQLARAQIQIQNETLNSWPEEQPGKQIEQAKREAYLARVNDLEKLLASRETLDFLTSRLIAETAAEKESRSFIERLQISFGNVLRSLSSVWDYEIFSVDDTIIADGQIISSSRPVTLKKLIFGLLLLTVGIWLVGKASKLLSAVAQRSLKVERSLILLFEKTGQFVAVMIVIVAALGLVQIPLAAFAFLGGALAIGVGFGGQNLINNFMSSLILLIEKPIKVGDMVEAEGVLGRVTAIGGRCSTIRRFDGVDLLVPNSHLLETTVVNRTLSDNMVRYEIKVGVAYGSPTREVFRILDQVMDEHGLVLKDPKPLTLLEDFAADALLFGLYYWIEVNERLDARVIASDLRHRIDRLFRDAGISIAFPQRDVHLDADNPLKIELVDNQQPEDDPVKTET